jgi:hypothetical protein
MRNPDGTFTKGNPGRPKGARNRATSQMREALKAEAVSMHEGEPLAWP